MNISGNNKYIPESVNAKIAIDLYDEGKIEKSIIAFQSIIKLSEQNAFYSWLNIAILEFERNDLFAANEALNSASKIKPRNYYILSCRYIFTKKNQTIDSLEVVRFKSTSDPIEKFFLWQLLFYKLEITPNNFSSYNSYLKLLEQNIVENTLRYAKILSKEGKMFYFQNELNKMVKTVLKSNHILETLNNNQHQLYVKNVELLFSCTPPLIGKNYYEDFTRYEHNDILAHNSNINSLFNFYKSRYFYYNGDITQSNKFIKKAYSLDKNNPLVINYLAFICRQLNNYKSALNYYEILKKYPTFEIEAYRGALKCTYNLGNEKLSRHYAFLLTTNANRKDIDASTLSGITYDLYITNQFELLAHLDKRIINQFRHEKSYDLSLVYDYTGNYLWRKGKFNKALDQFQLSIIAILPNEIDLNPYSNLNYNNCLSYSNLYSYLNNKGETFYQLSKLRNSPNEKIRDLKECLKNLNLSIEQIYTYKMQLSTEEQMFLFSELTNQKYPNIIKVCLELYNLTGDTKYSYQAFRYAEQGRAAIMLSLLRSNSGSKIGLIPAKYKAREDSLSLKISILQQRLSALKEESSSKYGLNTQIDALASKRAELEQLYKKQYPSYYNLKYSSETVNPVQFQASLADNECVVEYLLNRNFLISFYFDKKNLIFHTDTLRTVDLSALADRFYNRTSHFSTSSYKPDSIKQFANDAQKLYNILLKPFEQKIKGKKLIVIADNSLRKIPFEVLLTEKPADYTGYRNLPYLIKQNTVYYAPSVTFLDELRKKPALKHRARLLAVAPVYSSLKLNDTISRMLLAVRSDTSVFGSLPNAKKEIAFAHSMAGGRRLFEKRATETLFKKIAGDYDIIHLATHGILNSEASLQSKLLFSESSPDDDGFLHNYEIYNLKQSSQLVILSACNTGAGKNYGGEGVISTGRGFLSSGSRSVIMTLWPVNDLASFDLINGFYEGLKKDLDISDALRNSKLHYLGMADNMHSHPFFWTGYVVYGDASISLAIHNYKFLYIGIAIFILILGLAIWKFKVIPSINQKLSTYRKNGN